MDYYSDLLDVFYSDAFQELYQEMQSLPETERPQFVEDVFLDETVLQEQGVNVPDDVLIQRSSFGDRRPTLFCLKKYLPEEYQEKFAWQNVNLTFDNEHENWPMFEGEDAWRKPMHYDLEKQILSKDLSSEGSIE
ncbi:hypothetical protein [Halorhabdus sp. BNX81]|uniref:hypothetical protein n=1 Tax=Halorhabdus sp. BNX81 TaxID=2980181 RepID=UPI0023DD0CB2|nr:hypothetical protein [Halorhabdus sp. BNX81]WEL22681.1 hypothetical protein HBNXHr_2642 [Halorhabdus sp. BNX81]